MEILEVMEKRHSVRQYKDAPIEAEKREELNELAAKANEEGDLHIQIFYDEPKCFDSFLAHYGKFSGVRNYIALVGKKSADLDEKLGYYGEALALKAQELGLNTCWVALTRGKSAAVIEKGEKEVCIIALGYGENQGVAHKSKPIEKLCNKNAETPEWFLDGVKAAALAPTAMNQQKFFFELGDDGKVTAKSSMGFYSKVDLGIVKYHFEAASGKSVG